MKQVQQDFENGMIELAEIPRPQVRSYGVLVETDHSVVSAGTEKSMIELARKSLVGKSLERPDLVKEVWQKFRNDGLRSTYRSVTSRLAEPIPLGYSCAGTVVAVGDEVERFSEGDKVACAGAEYATHGEFNFVPQNLVTPIPDGVGTRDAAFSTVGAIAMQGVRRLGASPGERIAVIGLGLVGQLAAKILDAYGHPVLGVDIDPTKVADGPASPLSDGAVIGEDNVQRAAAEFGRSGGVDGVLIAAATDSNEPIKMAGEISREQGRVSVVGDVGMDVPRDVYYEKELDVKVSRSYGPGRYDRQYEEKGLDYPLEHVRWTEQRNMSEFLRLLKDDRVAVDDLVTHTFAFSEAPAAYDILLEGTEPFTGIVLNYGDATSETRIKLSNGNKRSVDSETLAVGVIGTGSFARHTLLPTIDDVYELELHAVSSASGRTAASAGAEYGASYVTSDYTDFLTDDELDVIVVATRHDLHAEMAVATLDAGYDVHVEKPLALDTEELVDVLEAEQASDVRLTVGYNRRFSRRAREIHDHFENRSTPIVAQYRVNAGSVDTDHWVNDPEEGGGRIIGEVCHFVDLLQYIVGERPESVVATGSQTRSETRHDNVQLTVRFADGSQGTITYTTLGDDSLAKESLKVFCNGQTEVIDNFKHGRFGLRQDKGFREEFVAFRDAIQAGNTAPITPEELAYTSLTTFDTLKSLRTGERVRVQLPERLSE